MVDCLTHCVLNQENHRNVPRTVSPCLGSCCTRWSSVPSFHVVYAKLMYDSTIDASVRGAKEKEDQS